MILRRPPLAPTTDHPGPGDEWPATRPSPFPGPFPGPFPSPSSGPFSGHATPPFARRLQPPLKEVLKGLDARELEGETVFDQLFGPKPKA